MKIIQVNSNVFKAFKAESQMNFDGGGNLLQTMAFALGYETNGGFKISELVFPSQDCEVDLVRETGSCIHWHFSKSLDIHQPQICLLIAFHSIQPKQEVNIWSFILLENEF